MIEIGQYDKLSRNYDELEDNKKDKLLKIGENLLGIQNLINGEKIIGIKSENIKLRKKGNKYE